LTVAERVCSMNDDHKPWWTDDPELEDILRRYELA
jgi:hypothetical protein